LDEIVEYTQALWVLGFGDIDERTNLGGLECGTLVSDPKRESSEHHIPRRRCVHCPAESLTPVVHPYSFEAICYHLPYSIVSTLIGPIDSKETYFIISLVLMMRLISSTMRELTHTVKSNGQARFRHLEKDSYSPFE
jgi:hypothetical protein